MSNCSDVCLDHDYDCDSQAFYRESIVTARKPHKCCECGTAIAVGTRYERASGKNDGAVWTSTSCLLCSEIRKAFVCGSWQFGDLWDSIENGLFPVWDESGPIDCLAKLDTLAARDLCRTRYAEWKGEAPIPKEDQS